MDKHKHKGSNSTKGQGQQGSNKGSRHRHGKYKNNPVQRQNSHLQGNSKAATQKNALIDVANNSKITIPNNNISITDDNLAVSVKNNKQVSQSATLKVYSGDSASVVAMVLVLILSAGTSFVSLRKISFKKH